MFSQGSSGGASRPPTVVSSAPVIEDILRRGASCTIHHDRKHAVGTTDGVVATAIPEMGCRRDSTVMAGCAGRTPRTPAAVATVTTPSNVVSAVSTASTRVPNGCKPDATARHRATELPQHSMPTVTPVISQVRQVLSQGSAIRARAAQWTTRQWAAPCRRRPSCPCPVYPGNRDVRGSFDTRNFSLALTRVFKEGSSVVLGLVSFRCASSQCPLVPLLKSRVLWFTPPRECLPETR